MSKIYNFEKFGFIKSLIRISSWFLILILLLAIFATLITSPMESFFINYFVVFLSIFALLINALTLIIISILYKTKNEEVFSNIKVELILFLSSVAGLMVLSAVIHLKM